MNRLPSQLIKRPLITEKTVQLAALQQYTFEVYKQINKIELKKAFELLFPGRQVLSVRLIKVPGKQIRRGRRVGRTADQHKAVFHIEGEPLTFFAGA